MDDTDGKPRPSTHEGIAARPYWYTAEEITQAVKDSLGRSQAEAFQWLVEGVGLLEHAARHGDLDRCLEQPQTGIDTRWDTLIAACIRYRLRTMGVKAPHWTYKQPLDTLWFIGGVTPRRVASAINLSPLELRRVGIMMPHTALDF